MPGFSQDHLRAKIETPLGKDVLLVRGLHGTESISQPFQFNLELASEKDDIQFEAIVGKNVTIEIGMPGQDTRYINGWVSSFSQGATEGRLVSYQAQLVPWFWFLSRVADCCIFQDKTIPQIIEDRFKDAKFTDYSLELSGSHPKWEYCVQYRETTFNFLSRLMEQEGIHYFFRHDKGKHTMVLTDSPAGNKACAQKTLRYSHGTQQDLHEGEVDGWRQQATYPSGRYTLADYNFKTPSTKLKEQKDTIQQWSAVGPREVYDYPGEYTVKKDGTDLADLRMEAEEAATYQILGVTDRAMLEPGSYFGLLGHPRTDFDQSYLLTSVTHGLEQSFGGSNEGTDHYENSFTCIPYEIPFRPVLATPKPVVQGLQSAVVTGKKGEEIDVDEHGRIHVQFHWDREGKSDENSSCRIRCSQPWAGGAFGAISIPRIGDEVLVDFLEGDPDRPVVTGRVYNGEKKPPYKLPDEKTKTTIMTRSTTEGGTDNYNELRFEDKNGKEQLYLRAERDYDRYVKNVARRTVGADDHLHVKKGQFEQIEEDSHRTVGGAMQESIATDFQLKVGTNHDEEVGQKMAVDAGQEIHLKAGMKVILEAGMQISLKAGGGFVDIGPAGVTISGVMVKINSGGAAGSGSGASVQSPDEPEDAPSK
jgi:type VI secretion system secreted protein VgrG